MPFAFSTRSRTELNLEMMVVAAMLAASSWPRRRRAAAPRATPLHCSAPRLSSTSPARPALALTSARRRLLARPHASSSPQRRLHARLPAAANARHPCARGRRSRPPLACVCGRRSGQRARASTAPAPSRPCVRLGAATTCTYIPGDFNSKRNGPLMCDFQLNDLTHEFDTRHAVTLPPGPVSNRSSWAEFMATPIGGGLQLAGLNMPDG